jgi:hypothetical protein
LLERHSKEIGEHSKLIETLIKQQVDIKKISEAAQAATKAENDTLKNENKELR